MTIPTLFVDHGRGAREQGQARSPSLRKLLTPSVLLIVLMACLIIGLGAATPGFFTSQNGLSIMRAASVTGICAVGLLLVTLTGNLFSLSTAATATFAAIVYSILIRDGFGTVLAIILTLLISTAIGVVQGAVVSLGLNPIITTLAASFVLTGTASQISHQLTINLTKRGSTWIGQVSPLGVPLITVIFVVLALALSGLLVKTRMGREMTLVGANRLTARSAGLRPGLIAVAAFAVASLLIGLAGMMQAATLSQANTDLFPTLTFDAITAVLVGGAALSGGRGSPLASAIGAIFIAAIADLLFLRGYAYGIQATVQGALVGMAVIAYAVRRRRAS